MQTMAVFRLSALGDIVLTTGVLDYWHRTMGMKFVYITRAGIADVLKNHPAIEEIVPLTPVQFKKAANWFEESGRLAERFADLPLVDLHGTLRSRILASRWKKRVASYPKFGLTRRLFNLTGLDLFRERLERTNVTQRYAMSLQKTAPKRSELLPKIYLTDHEKAFARVMVDDMRQTPTDAPLVALHPYATHPAKQWPAEHWRSLAKTLRETGHRVMVIGRDDEPLFRKDSFDLTNRTGLRETCALLEKADVLVTNDSGPMHLAAGVGTPVVAFFGPTVKSWGFQPCGPKDIVLETDLPCRPCSLHGGKGCARNQQCLSDISPAQTMQAIRKILF